MLLLICLFAMAVVLIALACVFVALRRVPRP